MPFLDFFRNFFGYKGSIQEPSQHRYEDDREYNRDSFRNPIWQNDDEEDDISDFSRHPRNRFQFRIFSDPFEMTRFFESQMDEMLSNFFGSFDGFGNRFGNNGNIFIPFENDNFSNALPPPNEKQSQGPLDEVLKPESNKTLFNDIPINPYSKFGDQPIDEVLKPSFEMPNSNSQRIDSDIDGKIKSDELAKIWKSPSSSQAVERFSPQMKIQTYGNSVSTQIVVRSDGSVEEHRTVRDNQGNEEHKVTRQIGDKLHSIITKKLKDGSKTITEDLVNMDENELKGFDEKWTKLKTPEPEGDHFPWYKFFGPNPKL